MYTGARELIRGSRKTGDGGDGRGYVTYPREINHHEALPKLNVGGASSRLRGGE